MNKQVKDMKDDVDENDELMEVATEEDEDDGEFEVEVVDDVPEDQRPRRAEDEPADLPNDDDLENYSESVQKRIKKLKFEYHEAERQKQEAARLREEAINYAKQVQQENELLRQRMQKSEGSLVEQAKARVESELSSAKSAYRTAYEAGDSDALIEAQSKLTQLQNDLYRLQNYRPQQAQPQPQAPQAPQAQPQPKQEPQKPKLTPRQQKWMDENPWYMNDRRMTSYALGVHEELVMNGVDPNSEKYYTEIDKELRKVFPDKFAEAAEEEVTPRQQKAANVVAPAQRSGKKPRSIKITSTQAAIAKRLGLTKEQYVAQLMKDARNG